jgi:uncharacterized protein (TIGR03382 family)
VRRAAGALFVFLVVIWLIQFAVWQIGDPARYVGRGEVIPPDFRPGLRFQPTAANEWQNAALNGGTGLLVIFGLGAAWRLRRRRAT